MTITLLAAIVAFSALATWRYRIMATKFDRLTAAVQVQQDVIISVKDLVVAQTKAIKEGGVDSVLLDGLALQLETQTEALKTVIAGNGLPVAAADPVVSA